MPSAKVPGECKRKTSIDETVNKLELGWINYDIMAEGVNITFTS